MVFYPQVTGKCIVDVN